MGISSEPLRHFRSCPGDPGKDLAFEEALLGRVPPPALFLYSWPRPTVVIGCGQSEQDVDLEFCRSRDIPVLRRSSGGTAIVHHGDLSVSLVLPTNHPWARRIGDLYDRFLDVIEEVLGRLGIETERHRGPGPSGRPRSPICFEGMGRETLLVAGRKAVGCAQTRRRTGVLVHGVLLRNLDPVLQASIFRTNPERIVRAMAPLPPIAIEDLCAGLEVGFREALEQVASRFHRSC